ncbi:MAG: hypothetical protein KF760_21460 [Candidatus Eremiobacteraeota bacterium]|nr:hypothetical protein [Candidatus Eremiobacteraeota bacterium]MCW5867572.1 hypothetical protein [Candidatus Eremiobacteraeota bacterium]
MKKLMLILTATGLLAGSAFAEWDFDVHGAEIARPRMALTQAQRAMFLAGLELELTAPVPVAVDPLEQAAEAARQAFEASAEVLQIEAAGR